MPVRKGVKPVAQNKRARHDYFIEESIECGLALMGTEVKSIRAGKVSMKESFAVIRGGEVFVESMHISPYEQGSLFNADPMRSKKLLLHKAEIRKLAQQTQRQGYTLIPLEIYLKDGRMKLSLGVCKGKHLHDKREDAAERDAKITVARVMRGNRDE